MGTDQANRFYGGIKAQLDKLTTSQQLEAFRAAIDENRQKRGIVDPVPYRDYDPVDLAIGKVDMPSWDRVVRAQLKERGLEYAGDEIYEVILRLSGAIAADRIKGVEAKAQKQIDRLANDFMKRESDRKAVYQPFVELLAPLVRLGLMPGDQIISVAVRDQTGDVRIIPVDRPDHGLD